MTDVDMYLDQILQKYSPRALTNHSLSVSGLKSALQTWAGTCYLSIHDSGSRAKGTAISLASDIDFLVSLTSNCNENSGGLKSIYNSLYNTLNGSYTNVRKQNVSVRLNLNGLQVDVTPARKQSNYTNDHSLYVSKLDTWKQTDVQKHITDVSMSGRINEIKLLKIWRELHGLDFPSIYAEYLLIKNVLVGKASNIYSLTNNFWYVLQELAKDTSNPLFNRVIDPANSNNVLSDLLTNGEKNKIITKAKESARQQDWGSIVW